VLDASEPERVSRLEALNKPIGDDLEIAEEDTTATDLSDTTSTDLLADNLNDAIIDTTESARVERYALSNPLLSVLSPAFANSNGRQVPQPGAVVGYAFKKDTAKVNEYLNMRQVKSIFPANVKLAWDAKPIMGENNVPTNTLTLWALKSRLSPPVPRMEGDVVVDAAGEFGHKLLLF